MGCRASICWLEVGAHGESLEGCLEYKVLKHSTRTLCSVVGFFQAFADRVAAVWYTKRATQLGAVAA